MDDGDDDDDEGEGEEGGADFGKCVLTATTYNTQQHVRTPSTTHDECQQR